MSKELDNAGRGLNIIVIMNNELVNIAHFDTYEHDSTNLELYLETYLYSKNDCILIVISHDEASHKLSFLAKSLFNQFGSNQIQNLKFRDNWYFIGSNKYFKNKNKLFTSIEEISYAPKDKSFAKPLNKRFCLSNNCNFNLFSYELFQLMLII